MGVWIGEQLLLAILTQATHSIGIAFWADVGGFATGLRAGFIFTRVVPPSARAYEPVNAPEEDYDRTGIVGEPELTQLNWNAPAQRGGSSRTTAEEPHACHDR